MNNLCRQSRSSQLVCCVSALSIVIQGCHWRDRDPGRELVNAAGISVQETAKVLHSGADVNKRSTRLFGWTPLISAIYHRKSDVVDLLLASGADVNLGDSNGRTPLDWAITMSGENTNLLRRLIQSGADPRLKSGMGTDAFRLAATSPNSEEIVAILEEFGRTNQNKLP